MCAQRPGILLKMQHGPAEQDDEAEPEDRRCEDLDLDADLALYLGTGCAACEQHTTPCWCWPDGP